MDDEKYQYLIQTKCCKCFRKDECMLYSSKHEGMKLCLGPFKDQEARLKKIREDFKKERKQKADLQKAMRQINLNTYLRNKKSFDDWLIDNDESSGNDE